MEGEEEEIVKSGELNFLETVGGVVLGTPLVMIVGIPLLLYRAWVFAALWLWFAVPAFSVKPLPFSLACGLLVLFSFLKSTDDIKREYKNSYGYQLAEAVFSPTIGLAFGFGIKWWFGL